MNVKFEKVDNVNARLTVSFVEEDYKADVKRSLNELGQRRPIKGFRPGHVPMGMLQRMYGMQVLADVVDRKLSREVSNYIVENKVPVLGEPMLSTDTRVDFNTQKDFEFTFDLGLEPEFDVTIDSTLNIPYYNIEVTDEMVEKQNASYRHRYGKEVPGEVSDEESHITGKLVELDEAGNEKADGIVMERAAISPKYDIKDEEAKPQFVGLKVGDSIVFNPHKATGGSEVLLASILGVDKEVAATATADFRFTVTEILVNQDAEMDQELFNAVLGNGVATTEEDYLAKVREMIVGQLKNDSNYRFTIDAREAITAAVGELEMPADFLKRFLLSRPDNENTDKEKFEEQFPDALKQIRWQIIEQKIASKLGVKVEEEDINRLAHIYAAQQYAQYGLANAPEEMINEFAQRLLQTDRFRTDMANRALEDKLYAAIKANANVEERTVSVEEFNKLFEKA